MAYITDHEALMQSIPQAMLWSWRGLDRFEMSATAVEGGNLVVLMLCARELEQDPRPMTSSQIENFTVQCAPWRTGAVAAGRVDRRHVDRR